MEENKNASNDASQKESLLDKAEKVWTKVEHEAEEAWNKAKNSEMADKAKVKLEELKEEAKHLYEQAKSGELTEKAKVKLEGLKEDAKELWNKVVDKLDKEDDKKPTPPQEDPK